LQTDTPFFSLFLLNTRAGVLVYFAPLNPSPDITGDEKYRACHSWQKPSHHHSSQWRGIFD